MRLYHVTDASAEIEREGFRDAEGTYLTPNVYRGVWLADIQLDEWGDSVFAIDIPEDEIVPYEWVEDGKPYREFLVPANTVNRFPRELLRPDVEVPTPGFLPAV